MIGAGLPQDVASAHPFKPAQYVLDRIVEGMPHMERARHIGRWDDDSERLRFGAAARLEIPPLFPLIIETGFHFGRDEGFIKHDLC